MVTVVTKTIGPTGRDYATFTLAEAAVESIATAEFGSTDLVTAGGAIVFEADAAVYDESVSFISSLTTDATRNVTYKPAAGSEHGGSVLAGVRFVRDGTGENGPVVYDEFTVLDGLVAREELLAQNRSCFQIAGPNVTLQNCLSRNGDGVTATTGAGVTMTGNHDGARVENCVAIGAYQGFKSFASASLGTITSTIVNCTHAPPTNNTWGYFAPGSGTTLNLTLINNLNIGTAPGTGDFRTAGSGTVNASGSNNFGVSTGTFPFPAAIQGSPYPVTASTAYDPGAGDFALYVSSTGQLLDSPHNDVIDGGVGPAANADVPTTDIVGRVRTGGTTNPGAFAVAQATRVVTKTIGPVGRDYATFTLAEAAVESIATAETGSTDLVAGNARIEFLADAGTYLESVNFNSSLTTDATRQVTYKPAAGSEHGGVFGGGVVLTATGGTDNQLQDDYMTLDGLEFTASGVIGSVLQVQPSTTGVSVTQSLISNPSYKAVKINEDVSSLSLVNCVFSTPLQESIYLLESSGTTTFSVINSTFLRSPAFATGKRAIFMSASGTASVSAEFINCLALEVDRVMTNAGVTPTGSNNFGGSTNPFPAAIQGSPYPITASTAYDPGAGDFALYVSSTGQLLDSPHNDVIDQGVGPTVNADVPTTDIVGRARTRSVTNPGAFAVAQATRVVTKTIGPTGRDYATFTLAEAAVESIATAEFGSTDLVANNGRIEFLADAGTYSESVTFSSTLTTDATRQVTYKPASGSEHGGVRGAGVNIEDSSTAYGTVAAIRDSFVVLDGLCIQATNGSAGSRTAVDLMPLGAALEGVRLQGLILSTGSFRQVLGTFAGYSFGSSSAPLVVENCVLHRDTAGTGAQLSVTGTDVAHARLVNTTCAGEFTGSRFVNTFVDTSASLNLLVVNGLNLVRGSMRQQGSGSQTITGSNNFGGSHEPFPAALQGSPYPVTATTNTDPGPGHFAIYDADTGALVNVAANTVWQRGVGPSANSDVPTTDIAGFTRSGATANPGAFAASTSLAQTTNPVARFFTYKRPSSQLFNHHRRVTCVFPDDGPSGNGNTFAVGVAARGFISPVSRDCVAFFVYYTTDGAGGQTSLRLEVARIVGQYSQDAIAEAQPIAVVEKQAVGEAIPAGFDFPGQSHTVAFKVQTFSGATTPESAAEYTAFIDGTAVTFDTFYQSATQDGTTKVVTHPAPAVGTTQGRAEAFFWYATADRTDSLGSANYALPQWSDWNQLAVDPDPIFDGEGQSITVEGEGTGTVNFSTALEHVDFAISVQYELPRFDTPFASGHRYTSPRFENSRRVITASATNIDKATMDLIVQFHAARKGIEEPFLFNFPIPDTTTSETYTVITVQFADTAGMVYRRDAENIYSVQLNMIELL